ncbi:MAG TPA: heme lyase CcmF/NrfE family subunit, partial [Actinobacteria bacterium]|nr:heme lyase CcmF/NrfE family subunit [Actinomycetes bacterium]HEX21556.1 heme lyase CcmF/NrfE family subunit [Actinomycetota bacterium]
MTAQIGYFSLVAAMLVGIYATVMPIVGLKLKRKDIIVSGERAAISVAGLMLASTGALLYAFLSRDFSIKYVYEYSNRALSTIYTISSWWAGNQGSLLMWAVFLSIYAAIAILLNRHKNRDMMPYVTTILSALILFFTALIVFMANPFVKMPYIPADGQGLNPMLHNPGMYMHPPATYLGYVGFAIPFAFAMAALLSGKLGDMWIRTTRRWAIWGWLWLTVGNLVGAWWAYYTLGWGGFWGWDPVESASFMPWLVGTAYLHSVMIQEKKGMLKIWNMALITITFSLTIYGTLITRSGIINSVHTFSQSGLGPYLMFMLLSVMFLGFGLILYRLPMLKTENELDSIVSRESAFLFNNLILLGIAFMVLWGVTFPFISEVVTGNKITVGPPFYNQMAVPLGLALLFLMGFCPLIAWRRASVANLQRNFIYPLSSAFAGFFVLELIGIRKPWAIAAFVLVIFVVSTIILEFYRGTKARHKMTDEDILTAFINLIWRNKRRY